ncbi:MAG: aspartate carbamoyltransferase catalytic subunit [Gammaproteobacteria bacterium]|nr:aspartate carbamoyltransferase catalytic subunit [Gammaproteobacteria bacterium]
MKSKIVLPHLLGINALSQEQITCLLNKAEKNLAQIIKNKTVTNTLTGRFVVNMFFEPSTRTRNSFKIAAQRLGGFVLSPDMSLSSTVKGEGLIDTVRTFEAMGADILVIRHSDNFSAEFIASELKPSLSVINAGDGYNQHPTQALIDLLTIQQFKNNFADIKVAIIGDIAHSRVARSLQQGLSIMGTKGIHLIGKPEWIPSDYPDEIKVFESLENGLKDVDVIVALRIQKERIKNTETPDPDKYYKEFGLTAKTVRYAKPDAIVLHPGPINRGIEIDSSVADGQQSKILQQVANGVAIRMAVMQSLSVTKAE